MFKVIGVISDISAPCVLNTEMLGVQITDLNVSKGHPQVADPVLRDSDQPSVFPISGANMPELKFHTLLSFLKPLHLWEK